MKPNKIFKNKTRETQASSEEVSSENAFEPDDNAACLQNVKLFLIESILSWKVKPKEWI